MKIRSDKYVGAIQGLVRDKEYFEGDSCRTGSQQSSIKRGKVAQVGAVVDKAGAGFLDSLGLVHDRIRQAIKKTLTVVEQAGNKGVNKDFSMLTAEKF